MQSKACATNTEANDNQIGFLSFQVWLDQIGITPTTGWRWRNRRWVKTINISGRLYISKQEIESFTKRAEAGGG